MQSGELLGYATMRADGHLYLQADHDRCCELHGRNCGPLSELCCGECTEASHDAIGFRTGVHEDGTLCSRPNLSANTVEEAGRREMADKVSRIRAHLEYLLGVADGATRPPWKVAGLTGVIADNGIDQGLVDATWSSLGVSADRNTVFIAAARTAVPQLATAVLAMLDWLEETAGDQEPVRAATLAEEGISLLEARIASPAPPPDLHRKLVDLLRRAGEVVRLLPESDRSATFAQALSGWSRDALVLALQGASVHIVDLAGLGDGAADDPR